ncbi:hypothetical protein BDF20DRAFT_839390 [Mycotypha africana]|uniref:uncharacterized protein n=1 Tax=Mycotypha africana TaxID=64632 RepID=UPI0023005B61|nr:uncharacterized protein BDF20DRAFT_839390 [Mycotypha africana]KAI8968267.1 hypothetical protein BDF20DRAFT_839390 [Mycotypha africana]
MSNSESKGEVPAIAIDDSTIEQQENQTRRSLTIPTNPRKSYGEQQLSPSIPVPQQQQQQQQPNTYMNQAYFYNFGHLANQNPYFFMQPNHNEQQQQQNIQSQSSMLQQALNNNVENNLSHSNLHTETSNENITQTFHTPTGSIPHSTNTSMESFQAAVSSTVGNQPPSFWSGINNFLSNVTHTNLFPTIPNIARSFSEYLSSHPVPFLSSFNSATDPPTTASSPIPTASMDFEAISQFKQEHLQKTDTGLQIRVLGVPQTGAKSRVETQIKLCIQLVTDGGDKAQWWTHLRLPEHMITKDKAKQLSDGSLSLTGSDNVVCPEKTLKLQARVLCASDPSKKVTPCIGCIQRERKRSQKRKENKQQQQQQRQQQGVEDTEDEKAEDEHQADEDRILLFNCPELIDFSAGDTILPTRITCYCRHHNERLGFCISFEMVDHTGKKVAEGFSPPIMITDDHKSNKTKSGLKRRRTEAEGLPEPRLPTLNWIKSSLPFVGNKPTDSDQIYPNDITSSQPPQHQQRQHQQPPNTAEATTSSTSYYTPAMPNMDTMKSMLTSMFFSTLPQTPQTQQQQQISPQQPHQYIQSLHSNNDSASDFTATANSSSHLISQQQQHPVMKRLIPNEASTSGGLEITILGSNFRPGLTVMFGDKPATNIQYWSTNTLICTLPPAAQSGAVVVSFKEAPPMGKNNVMVFTYLVETDRALMELALQVVGMKMTGIVEDARKIAMRIVQGNNNSNNNDNDNSDNNSSNNSSNN